MGAGGKFSGWQYLFLDPAVRGSNPSMTKKFNVVKVNQERGCKEKWTAEAY